jgi:hypothetical protein
MYSDSKSLPHLPQQLPSALNSLTFGAFFGVDQVENGLHGTLFGQTRFPKVNLFDLLRPVWKRFFQPS